MVMGWNETEIGDDVEWNGIWEWDVDGRMCGDDVDGGWNREPE